LLLSVGRGRVWHMRRSRRSSSIGSIGGGRIWNSSLRGSPGIPQTGVGSLGRVLSAAATADTGEVQRRREDDAEGRSRVWPAAEVDGTVRIGVKRGGSRGGRGGDVRGAHTVGASAVATAAAILTVIIIGGVLAVAVPVTTAVTTRVLLEPFVDVFRVARLAVPFDNHADGQCESDHNDDSDDAEGHANASFVREKTFGGSGRCWTSTHGGQTEGIQEGAGRGAAGTAEGRYTSRLVGI